MKVGDLARIRALWIALALLAGAVRPVVLAAQEVPAGEPQRLIVRAVRVEGNQRYTAEQLTAAFGQRVGEPLLDAQGIKRGIEVLFESFRVRAQAELLPPADSSREVELLLRVEELPLDLELRIVGNSEIDDEKVREWAGLGTAEELYVFQASRVKARLEQRYREEGFYFVEVKVVERPAGVDPDTQQPLAPDVILEIQEGPEVKVRKVELHGNDLLPPSGMLFWKSGLAKLAKTELRGPWWFGWFAKDFVRETLDADVLAMRQVYRDLGYLDAVVELEELEFSDDRSWVTIHVRVDRGPLYEVERIEIQGLRRVRDESVARGFREEPEPLIVDEAELLPLLKLHSGAPFERRFVEEDHRELRRFYGARGHIEHPSLPEWEGFRFLEPDLVFAPDAPRVRVVYRLVQGAPVRIREIVMAGNLHTQDRVLRGRLTVHPGDLADPEQIERSRARIEATGFFSPDAFHPEVVPPDYRFLDTGDPAWKDLEYRVEEGGVLSFQISGGVSSTIGAFGRIQLRKGNFDIGNLPSSFGSTIEEVGRLEAFHGGGQSLSFDASPGTKRTYFGVTFSEPDLFRLQEERIGMRLSATRNRRRYRSHLEERREYAVQLSRQVGDDSSVWVRYLLGSVEVTDLDTGLEPSLSNPLSVPASLDAQKGKSDLSHLDLGYSFDTVDNRLVPRNGVDVDISLAIYDRAVGSDFEFTKTQLRLDFYDEFDEDPDIVSDYVHVGFLAGVAIPHGESDEVPYTERWFLGGRQMRGFDYRGVGPVENLYPIGGATALYGTLEYRRPLVKNIQPGTYREIEAIQGGVFVDAGVLDPSDFSLDFGELRVSAGVLFGISFPLPLTFSFGFPLRSGDGDDEQVFEFDIGF
jgi:outer membrane protein insertion porin family